MTAYARNHAKSLASLEAKGTAITFALDDPGAEQSDGTFSGGTSSTVAGYATDAEEGGAPAEYARLGLTESEAPRLFFIASTYGDAPEVGARCTWGGESYVVKSVDAYRPDGVALFSYVIIGRGP